VNASRPRGQTPLLPSYVLVDGSALFLAVRALGDGRALDYRALMDVLCENVPGLTRPGGREDATQWVMWTSASTDNAGQNRFLEFAEKELLWTVRRVAPAESFMVDPAAALGITQDSRAASRLVRFDASIAFATARVADTHRVVVVSDSFPLADPLQRACRFRGVGVPPNVLAFFGRAVDGRWQRLLRDSTKHGVQFVDLDEFEAKLFGGGKEVSRSASDEDRHPF
jgi:hypothetical protein